MLSCSFPLFSLGCTFQHKLISKPTPSKQNWPQRHGQDEARPGFQVSMWWLNHPHWKHRPTHCSTLLLPVKLKIVKFRSSSLTNEKQKHPCGWDHFQKTQKRLNIKYHGGQTTAETTVQAVQQAGVWDYWARRRQVNLQPHPKLLTDHMTCLKIVCNTMKSNNM